MYDKNQDKAHGFPDPLSPPEIKSGRGYGLKYAKAIEKQWGTIDDANSVIGKRNAMFSKSRDYANGTQDTSIYKQLLHSLDPTNNDGSLLNLDYTPVPIMPKFVKVVVNKILSRDPYPNLEAIDPLSSSEKNKNKRRMELQVQAKKELQQLKQQTGAVLDLDPDDLPETLEEAEIFMGTNIKTDAEIAAQVATNLTLSWCDYNESVYRRSVNDMAVLGMAVNKRVNDPSYGIKAEYVDPSSFVHSFTDDPNFTDIVYAGHVKRIPIHELKRLAGDEFDEEEYKKIATTVKNRNNNDPYALDKYRFDDHLNKNIYGYDEYMVDILYFEFKSTEKMYFEEKDNRYGNTNFFYKGSEYKERTGSVYERRPHSIDIEVVYSGSYILGSDKYLFNYKKANNMPRNMHDISRTRMSYSIASTNMRRMMPKSMVDSCIGFADMLQLTHLKIQQAIAKAKPDGLIIDIEGLENVQLGKGGELQPLDLHDIYEQTGVFYYRSKNPEGGFQNPPIREIGNTIRNINELVSLYNHYLRMIRDVTGINEVVDSSSPKGEDLVGVREQAIAAANNAIYDITNSSMVLYKKVVEDIVKSLQVLPRDSVVYKVYENAVGEENMRVISSFRDLPMYNFGVIVVKEMEDKDKAYLEQNIQMSIQQKELDIEDAIAIRNLKDINQAERLLVVRRAKRIKRLQEQAQQNSQMQAQLQAQSAQSASQAKMQEMQLEAQLEAQKIQLKAELDAQIESLRHGFNKEIEVIRAQATLGFKTDDKEFEEKIEVFKEQKKDERVEKQANEQERLINIRKQNG
jgi:hypothetical protein